ncbi:hypothetical protein F4556_006585 [Kitasatospora gansuensis]|uniref:Uncharacterized protein n=1 Tax=Kitasatospora gansuensis TaxID=258050 RepID=A0A7W7SIG1_9ACTN|nr:hypothetical protein [Kitasatospora gansuensis]MBB4951050.1 hypothetical protein [Kitasatospora gansuensis]
MFVFEEAGPWLLAVAAVWSLVRLWAGDVGPRSLLPVGLWTGLLLVAGEQLDRGWMSVLAWVVIGLALLACVVNALHSAMPAVVPVPGDEFAARLVAAARANQEQGFRFGVGHDGTLMVWGLEHAGIERSRFQVGSGCPVCFLEAVVLELTGGSADGFLTAYRRELARDHNSVVVMRGGEADGGWLMGMLPVRGLKRPFRTSCGKHPA